MSRIDDIYVGVAFHFFLLVFHISVLNAFSHNYLFISHGSMNIYQFFSYQVLERDFSSRITWTASNKLEVNSSIQSNKRKNNIKKSRIKKKEQQEKNTSHVIRQLTCQIDGANQNIYVKILATNDHGLHITHILLTIHLDHIS